MIAIADDAALYLLEFTDKPKLDHSIKRLTNTLHAATVDGITAPITSIKQELAHYFNGTLKTFATPLHLHGTDFQKEVWQALCAIPHGQTCSYAQLAAAVGRPKAFRAVARANSTNRLPLIIPCHRVVNSNNKLGGYSSGIARKQWLLAHERVIIT